MSELNIHALRLGNLKQIITNLKSDALILEQHSQLDSQATTLKSFIESKPASTNYWIESSIGLGTTWPFIKVKRSTIHTQKNHITNSSYTINSHISLDEILYECEIGLTESQLETLKDLMKHYNKTRNPDETIKLTESDTLKKSK